MEQCCKDKTLIMGGGEGERAENKTRETQCLQKGLGLTGGAESQPVNTTYGCLSFGVSFGRLKYDSLELVNDALLHLEEPICQCSDKVNNSLWHRTCMEACPYRRRRVSASGDNLTLRWR